MQMLNDTDMQLIINDSGLQKCSETDNFIGYIHPEDKLLVTVRKDTKEFVISDDLHSPTKVVKHSQSNVKEALNDGYNIVGLSIFDFYNPELNIMKYHVSQAIAKNGKPIPNIEEIRIQIDPSQAIYANKFVKQMRAKGYPSRLRNTLIVRLNNITIKEVLSEWNNFLTSSHIKDLDDILGRILHEEFENMVDIEWDRYVYSQCKDLERDHDNYK